MAASRDDERAPRAVCLRPSLVLRLSLGFFQIAAGLRSGRPNSSFATKSGSFCAAGPMPSDVTPLKPKGKPPVFVGFVPRVLDDCLTRTACCHFLLRGLT